MTLAATILSEESELDSIYDDWDALAVEASRPFCAPGWMLAWWRNAAPDGGRIRVVTVRDGGRLVGIAPLWAAKGRGRRSAYEALTGRLSPPVGPIAAPGREREVAEALAEALTGALSRPSTLRLADRVGPDSMVDRLLDAWPTGRPWVHMTPRLPVPIVSLEGMDYDSWMASKSSKFRQESRRRRRRLEDAGACFKLARMGDLDRSLDAFIELHAARWQGRGGSNALIPGLRGMLSDAARELVPAERLRIFTIEAHGKAIAASVLVAAGEQVSGWGSGFDESWGRYAPSVLLMLHSLADAAERGEARMELGPGDMDYKRRVADWQEEMAIVTLVPRGVGYPLTRLRLVPHQARWGISRRISPDAKLRLRRLRGLIGCAFF